MENNSNHIVDLPQCRCRKPWQKVGDYQLSTGVLFLPTTVWYIRLVGKIRRTTLGYLEQVNICGM